VITLTNRIKAKAINLGFYFCGITHIGQTEHTGVYLNWISDGYAGEMAYLTHEFTKQGRKNPATLLEDAQSAIVVGIHYQPVPDHKNRKTSRNGSIASYAVYEDYHDVIRRKIQELMDWLGKNSHFPLDYRVFVDSGPVMEKDFALQAGLGMIGKNSLLYHPKYGSYLFLGCVFTNLNLQEDQPLVEDICGSCSACIQACPTNCILDNRTIDARKCISYLTIEHKGIIPIKLRPKIGSKIFGCDICQIACPVNQNKQDNFAKITSSLKRIIPSSVNLLKETQLSEDEFRLKYRNTVITRLSHEYFTRNLVIAMGNLLREEYLPVLKQFLESHKSPNVRAHTAWALSNYKNQSIKETLASALKNEKNLDVIYELELALSNKQ
jgi:epoxyqueuosine reductase